MKRTFILTIMACILCLTGCEKDSHSGGIIGGNTDLTDSVTPPVVKWYKIVNYNGFDTFIMEIENVCTSALDGDFKASFYDAGNKLICEVPGLYYIALAPGKKWIIWYNSAPIGNAVRAEIQNTTNAESYYTPVVPTKTKEQPLEDGVTLGFSSPGAQETGVMVVFYENNNIVGLDSHSFFTVSDEHHYQCGNHFTHYETYAYAYTY